MSLLKSVGQLFDIPYNMLECGSSGLALGIYMVQLTLDDGVRPGRVETGVGSSGNTTRIEGIQILGFVGGEARVSERLEAVVSGKNTLGNFWGTEDNTVHRIIQR